MGNEELLKRLSSFEGVFCSVFFIPDQAVVTALSLLFERVHFLNQLEYAIELSKTVRITLKNSSHIPELKIEPKDGTAHDPLTGLNDERKRTVHAYLILSDEFFLRNALLFPKIFRCNLFPDSKVITATLIKEGRPGELNTYEVRRNPLVVCTEGFSEVAKHIDAGRVPILCNSGNCLYEATNLNRSDPKSLAASLAIRAVAMSLPATKPAKEEDILEARERLRDHLPPFWSAMLKLSIDLEKNIDTLTTPVSVQKEVSRSVDTVVRPALIDLLHKLELEKKDRFKRILASGLKALKIFAGKPTTDLAGLVSASALAGADAALDFAEHLRKVEAMKRESGLTYLIEVAKDFS